MPSNQMRWPVHWQANRSYTSTGGCAVLVCTRSYDGAAPCFTHPAPAPECIRRHAGASVTERKKKSGKEDEKHSVGKVYVVL